MEKITIQQYGGEVKFTRDIRNNDEWSQNLLNACDYRGDFKMVKEEETKLGKRIDLVASDLEDNVLFAIECQDANGWLDMHHATKTVGYCFDQGTRHGIIICENVEEDVRDFLKDLITVSPYEIYVVQPIIIKHGDEIFVDFTVNQRPYTNKQKAKIITNKTSIENRDSKAQAHQSIFDAYPNNFNTVVQEYVSMQNVGKFDFNIDILDRGSKSYCLRVKGKAEMTKTDKKCEQLAKILNDSNPIDFEWKNNTSGAYITFQKEEYTLEDVVGFHKNTVDFCDSLAIL